MTEKLLQGLDPYEAIVKKTLDKFIPLKVDWEITYRCNLKCSHCYQTGPTKEHELNIDQICSVIDQLADLGSLYITFTGGEILLREDFFEVAEYARKKEFAIRLFTNGTLIDEEIADRIKALDVLAVEISLYGMDRAIHEKITGIPGSYEKTLRSFKLLKKRNINTVVKCTFMEENAGEFDKLKQFAHDNGLAFLYSFTVIPSIDGSRDILKYRLDESKLKKIFSLNKCLTDGIAEGGVQSFKPLCSAGFNSLYISPYGEVFPCVVLRQNCGNLKQVSIRDAWASSIFEKIRNIEFQDLSECKKCDLSGYCDRCAGLAVLENQDLLGPSVNDCLLAKVRKWALEGKNEK